MYSLASLGESFRKIIDKSWKTLRQVSCKFWENFFGNSQTRRWKSPKYLRLVLEYYNKLSEHFLTSLREGFRKISDKSWKNLRQVLGKLSGNSQAGLGKLSGRCQVSLGKSSKHLRLVLETLRQILNKSWGNFQEILRHVLVKF